MAVVTFPEALCPGCGQNVRTFEGRDSVNGTRWEVFSMHGSPFGGGGYASCRGTYNMVAESYFYLIEELELRLQDR